VLVVAAVSGAAGRAHPARADETPRKKKPGLFDFGGWKTPAGHERDAARDLAPGGLDLAPAVAGGGEPRPVRLRIYADRDYRATLLRWQTRARAQIDHVNQVVGRVFDARFEIESFREWDRSHTGVSFDAMLAELTEMDAGDDVDWVVGLVTPFRGVTTSIHQLGGARLLSRHFVLRAMDDEQEGAAIDRSFSLLSAEERHRLYDERKAHKEIVIFLHEWAHTMGALHNEDPTVVMNPRYDPKERGFSDFEKQLMALVLERRLGHPGERFPEGKDLAGLLEGAPTDEGSDKERAGLLAEVRGMAADRHGARPGRAGGSSGGEAALDLPAAEVASYNQAVAAVNAGRAEEAWAHLEPLVLKSEKGAPGPANASTGLELARLALAIGALTAAETTLGGGAAPVGSERQKLAADIETRRRRLVLPRDAARWGVPAGKEVSYGTAFREAMETVSSGRAADVRERARAFAAAYPDAPGNDVVACGAEMRAGRQAQAAKRCEGALAKYDEAVPAHFLIGMIEARAGREAGAVKHLRRAILLDPGSPGAWQELARFYRLTRANQRLSELRAQHEALLAAPLPE
jgi:tetratricopeptide (TPR) repeat protein